MWKYTHIYTEIRKSIPKIAPPPPKKKYSFLIMEIKRKRFCVCFGITSEVEKCCLKYKRRGFCIQTTVRHRGDYTATITRTNLPRKKNRVDRFPLKKNKVGRSVTSFLNKNGEIAVPFRTIVILRMQTIGFLF